jgi:RsmE family RNA methyltransferase
VAHPSSHLQQAISKPIAPIPGALHDPKIPVAIGPEGGFTEYEIGLFQESGYQPLSLGSRIYSVECAVPSLHQIILSNRPVPGEMNP